MDKKEGSQILKIKKKNVLESISRNITECLRKSVAYGYCKKNNISFD